MQPMESEAPKIYSVTRLNNEIRYLLEDQFPAIWVEGEISNFTVPHSGHWYFSLKDDNAQVRCALFKGSQRSLGFVARNGMHVLIRARASLYPNRGEYQLIAEFMEERGEGKLRRAFELLRKKLETAGLFHPDKKKTLPAFPRQIGVITSSTGAAIHDILHVLKRRYACVPVIIYPTLVQGELAAPAIVKAIQIANARNECDVLILARGGGSLEDLWPFNEESVAYAIFESHIPLISGVGHEVDFTIGDFVADVRAPTPSAAAEIITPDQSELSLLLQRQTRHLLKCMQHQFVTIKQHLNWSQKHLQHQHPKRKLTEKMQRLDYYETTLIRQMSARLTQQKARLAHAATQLNTMSPLATLERGYAIATTEDQHVIHAASDVKKGDTICVRVRHALLDCKVESVEPRD